jgi:hypothetical protein
MFPVLTQVLWLLFGSGAELATPREFVSCRLWLHEDVLVTPVWCLCQPIGQLEFCAGDMSSDTPFLEVYPFAGQSPRPYLHMRLQLQGD